MSLLSLGFDNEYYATILSAGALLVVAVHVVPYVVDTHKIRGIPGPWLAKFSDAWLGRVAARGHRSEVVHELHKQYGEISSTINAKLCLELTTHYRRFLRDICTSCPEPRVNLRPRCSSNRLCPWKRKFEEQFLRRVRLNSQRPFQHPKPCRSREKAQDRLSHLLPQERPRV